MYLSSFLRGRKGRGTAPFPCNPSPKTTATPRKLGRLHRRLDRPCHDGKDARRRPRPKPGGLCGAGSGSERAKGSPGTVGGTAGGSQILAASADRAKKSRSEGYLHRLRGWVERISGSDRTPLSSHRGAALHRAFGAGFAELCALEAPQVGGSRSAADLSCGHERGSPAESGGGNSEVERLSEPEPGVAAELGAHHAFFPLSRRHSQGDLYHQ